MFRPNKIAPVMIDQSFWGGGGFLLFRWPQMILLTNFMLLSLNNEKSITQVLEPQPGLTLKEKCLGREQIGEVTRGRQETLKL